MTASLRLFSTRCLLGRTPDGLRVAPARIEIRDGRIAAVVEDAAGPEAGDHDLRGQLLAPAFVNAHTHLALHACRGLAGPEVLRGNLVEDLFFRVEQHLEPADVEAFSRVGALECLLAGVGTVFDHYYHALSAARAIADVGLAAVIAPTLQDRGGPGTARADEALADTVALDTDHWSQRGIVAAVGPHATDTVGAKVWAEGLELARSRNLVVHAHLAQSAEEARRCFQAHGCGPVEWLEREGLLPAGVRQLFVHALQLGRADLGRLRAADHVLGASPFSQMQFGFPAAVGEWTEAGLDWFVGTDTGASNDSMDVQKELRLLAGQSDWAVTFSPERFALRESMDIRAVESVEECRRDAVARSAVLRDPASLLHRVLGGAGLWHPGLRAGVLEPGAQAQLCVYDLEHPALWPGTDPLRGLAFGATSAALTGVIARGRWVGEPGRPGAVLQTPEVREWMTEASMRRAELLRRAGLD